MDQHLDDLSLPDADFDDPEFDKLILSFDESTILDTPAAEDEFDNPDYRMLFRPNHAEISEELRDLIAEGTVAELLPDSSKDSESATAEEKKAAGTKSKGGEPPKKKRKTSTEGEGDVLSFDAKVKENVTGGARRGQLSSRGALDDMNAIHIPPPPEPLYIDTSIPPRGTGPDVIYPKVSISSILPS